MGMTFVGALGCSWDSGQPSGLSVLGPQYIFMLCALLFVVPMATPLILYPLAVAMDVLSVHQVGKSEVTVTCNSRAVLSG
jgi:hypothetical protein